VRYRNPSRSLEQIWAGGGGKMLEDSHFSTVFKVSIRHNTVQVSSAHVKKNCYHCNEYKLLNVSEKSSVFIVNACCNFSFYVTSAEQQLDFTNKTPNFKNETDAQ
jgi:hypothetical protein